MYQFTNSIIKRFSQYVLIVLILLFSSLFLLPFSNRVFADGLNSSELFQNVNPDVPKDIHTLSHVVMFDLLSAVACQLGGVDPTRKDGACLGIEKNTGKIGFVKNSDGGVVGFLGGMIAATFTLPSQIHSGQYFAYLGDHFGFAHKAYAQKAGVGFAGISPFLNIWAASRNIVYLLFVIIFVIVGIGIMLRIKIDPRTVMTIENQLPKIIIGLILVSFSFAIAGFFIDIMWVLTFMVINLLATVDPNINAGSATLGLVGHPLDFFSQIWTGGIWNFAGQGYLAISGIVHNIFTPQNYSNLQIATNSTNNQSCPALDFGCYAQGILGLIVQGLFLLPIVFLLIYLIFLIAIIVILFRVWWMLIKAYAFILLDIILAPFWIIMGAFPESTLGFGGWARHISANLLTFPFVVTLFLLARALSDAITPNVFIPPLLGNTNTSPVLIGIIGFQARILNFFIVISIIFIASSADKILKDALKSPDNKYLGTALAAGLGAGGRSVGGTIRETAGGYTAYQFDPLDPRFRGPGGAGGLGRVFSRWFR